MRLQMEYFLIFPKLPTLLIIKIIFDYLKNRQQFVQFNGFHSSNHFIKCGVPPGSILGPLLSLIYIKICVKCQKF